MSKLEKIVLKILDYIFGLYSILKWKRTNEWIKASFKDREKEEAYVSCYRVINPLENNGQAFIEGKSKRSRGFKLMRNNSKDILVLSDGRKIGPNRDYLIKK